MFYLDFVYLYIGNCQRVDRGGWGGRGGEEDGGVGEEVCWGSFLGLSSCPVISSICLSVHSVDISGSGWELRFWDA